MFSEFALCLTNCEVAKQASYARYT